MLEGDQQALTECVVNLVDNAIKYSADIKHLSLRTYQTKSHAIIEVGDKGIGIPTGEKKHIFDKFYRVTKGALAHHAKGSGLGLSIVTHLIKEHRGKVEVDSAEGKGSTFRILLPIKQES
jgi:two-component system phosphate regulon sensor histidine kinase PhoR